MLHKNSGFTFAELMVVLGIIAIISAFAIPGLIGWIPKHKLGAASRNLMSTLEGARMRAVRDRVSVGLAFDINSRNYRVWIDDGSGGPVTDANDGIWNGVERIIVTGETPAGITIAAVDFSGATSFRFDSQGFPIGTGGNQTAGSITVTNTRDSRDIVLTLAGNASIVSP